MKRDLPLAPLPPWGALVDAASAPYRAGGRFAYQFARGKLTRDPVFRALVERRLLPDGRYADIGCGQALLAALLLAVAGRPGLPQATAYLGIELMPRDVARARAALAGAGGRFAPTLLNDDMRRAALPPCDAVVILDVLHYVDHAAQAALLARVRDALAPARGRLLLRVGDMAAARGYAISQWVDRFVTRLRGHRVSPTWGRPLAHWVALLEGLGFTVQALPMSEGTPFANVLLVADLGTPAR
jgi:SAM-dependent methyltransferase